MNSVLLQTNEVTCLAWCPRSENLNVCTKDANRLFLWSPKGASVCQVPMVNGQFAKQKVTSGLDLEV